jgi:hypothetical protein
LSLSSVEQTCLLLSLQWSCCGAIASDFVKDSWNADETNDKCQNGRRSGTAWKKSYLTCAIVKRECDRTIEDV